MHSSEYEGDKLVAIDCSGHTASNDNLARLNEYFQKKQLPALVIESSKTGPDHQPTFTCYTKFEKKIYTATSLTKKEAEKKIKSYIYEHCINAPIVRPVLKNAYLPPPIKKYSSAVQVAEYENFRKVLANMNVDRENDKPVLVIDLLNIDIEKVKTKEFEHACQEGFSKMIVYTYHELLEWENTIVLINKESDEALIHESINRIIYYLLDHNLEKEIVVLTTNKYPLAALIANKTGQKLICMKDPKFILQQFGSS